jgi:thiol-disulfide isomerase/thioredoxin
MRKDMLVMAMLLLPAAAASIAPIDLRWTKAAERHYLAVSATAPKQLPELRMYDAHHRLILHIVGMKPGTLGADLSNAARHVRAAAGPSYADTMAELETRDGRPARAALRSGARFTVVDYWAEWCAPCKVMGTELETWAALQPAGTVQVVRAETDPLAAARAAGAVIRRYRQGPNGKLVEVKD